MFNKNFSLILALLMLISALGGCKNTETKQGIEKTVSYGDSYPLESDTKLTYWVEFPGQSVAGVTNFSELPFYKEIFKKTGVEVEFIHPTSPEQYNLMLASGEYPDIMEIDFYNFPGGPEKAISDEYIIPLNDTISKYAPNLTKYYKENPFVDKLSKTDTGTYYNFPFIRGDKTLMVFSGTILRQDWLTELGLEVPETIDEWYIVLKAFKEQKGAVAPLSFQFNSGSLWNSAAFIGAYNTRQGLYVDNGKIKYGEMEPGYKEFLTTFRKWYQEGLIDKNIASVDGKILDANILDNKTAAMIGNVGGGIGKWTKAAESINPDFKLVAAPYPTLNKEEISRFGQWDLPSQPNGAASISTQCKDIELAARFLDYGYSEEGKMLFNFGTEGVSYNIEDGYPKYTDVITNDPQGKSLMDMIGIYCRPNGNGPFIQDPRYMEQNAALPEQKHAMDLWSSTKAEETILPRITLTPEESNEISTIKSDLDTYSKEMFLSFLMGTTSLDQFDAFEAELKRIGVEKYIAVHQAALDRYQNR